jgi:WXG100 family type VII secretion target
MADGFAVDLNELDRVVGHLEGLSGYLEEVFEEIDRRVKALGSGVWEGAAATAYAEAHRVWSASAQEFAQGVIDAASAARTAHSNYSRAGEITSKALGG